MTYLNETIFSQTENFSSDIRQIFLEQYYNLVIVPLLKNLERKGRFSYEEVIKMLFYLHNSLFYLLPEDFLWSVFEKAIENNSFINKPYLKEEDIFLKIVEVLASKEKNAVRLIERLNKTVSTKNKMSLLEYLYDRIHGENFIKFASIINEAWRKTRFIDPSTETNPEYQSTNGPLFLPYQSEKIASFFFDNITANFEDNPKDKNERILQFNFKTGKTHEVPAANTTGQKTEEIIEKYYYHPFYPVKITNTNEESTSEQETSIKLDAIVPAFMLMANTNMQFWKNVIKTGEYTLDAIVIATSYGALSEIVAAEVITTLAVVRGIGATAAITSSVANTILKLANAEDSALVQEFIEYLFWIEMLSLSGELTVAIKNGLKKAATKLVDKEEDLAKLEKQLDEAVIEENGKKRKLTQEEKDEILEELKNRSENYKIDNFIERGIKNGKTIGKIAKEVIIRELHNVTETATQVSRALKNGKIKLIKLDEADFFKRIKAPGEKLDDIKDVLACQINDIIYIKNSTSLDKAFGEIVHEGKHALDELDGLFKNEKLLREETKLIVHDKISMKSYVDKMTKDQVIELRARIAEREFQLTAKQKPDFSSVAEMISFIFKKY